MEIRLLGTGTPTPSLERMSSGYLVRVNGDVLLFDHGPGAYHRMMEVQAKQPHYHFLQNLLKMLQNQYHQCYLQQLFHLSYKQY